MTIKVDLRKHPMYSSVDFYKPYCKIRDADLLTVHLEKTNARVRLLNDDGTTFKTLDICFKYITNVSINIEF